MQRFLPPQEFTTRASSPRQSSSPIFEWRLARWGGQQRVTATVFTPLWLLQDKAYVAPASQIHTVRVCWPSWWLSGFWRGGRHWILVHQQIQRLLLGQIIRHVAEIADLGHRIDATGNQQQ
jgi:hypothetical protein